MDSFFSLFDPSEGKQAAKKKHRKQDETQDTAKKKPDAPKGRRRGRRSHGKHETLPEESSFLCEPDLSTDVLVKDGSYIESYFEANTEDPDPKDDKKPKRRNSSRKNRRKKNKVSPCKETATAAWTEEVNWNNQTNVQKICQSVGQNVNDLSSKNSNEEGFDEKVYNIIDKLEKVGLKDDTFLAGDFDAEELEKELYSDEEMDNSFDDSESDADSSSEVYGSLPPEPRFGNVEYKLQLVAPCEKRFQHLVTQLKWRLRSGGGSAVYVLGVRDCGALRGLTARALRASLMSLRAMARALSATVTHISARRVAPQRAVAEVYIRKLADNQQNVELRVAVLGANEAGKSTLVGVLTQGELDNGRGSARLNMFRHLHEVKSGRTSSLCHEILGFDAQGNVVNYGCSELMTAERIGERSAKLVWFLDLAGHSKYQRTTLTGLCGYRPRHAILVISGTGGISTMTREHLALLVGLSLPFVVVVTKCELLGRDLSAALTPLLGQLAELLAPDNKKPLLITDENMARNCVLRQSDEDRVPVFPVSCVKGSGLRALHTHLGAQPAGAEHDQEGCEFQIDEIFHVDSGGPVVGGLVARGQIYEGDDLIIGPFETGEFRPISVCTIYRNRARCGGVRAGHCASLGLRGGGPGLRLRPGMVLLRQHSQPAAVKPVFGGCEKGKCRMRNEATDIVLNRLKSKDNTKNRKAVKRKNKNILQDIANAESSLAKDMTNDQNIYVSDSERRSDGEKLLKMEDSYRSDSDVEKSQDCICGDAVLLEDPNDPRGCMFFQASLHLLRDSAAIFPGFQCTVHIGNVRQTAIIEGILSRNSEVRAGESAPIVFRFTRCPEYLPRGRRLLLTAGQGTRGIGRVTQVFPYVP